MRQIENPEHIVHSIVTVKGRMVVSNQTGAWVKNMYDKIIHIWFQFAGVLFGSKFMIIACGSN